MIFTDREADNLDAEEWGCSCPASRKVILSSGDILCDCNDEIIEQPNIGRYQSAMQERREE